MEQNLDVLIEVLESDYQEHELPISPEVGQGWLALLCDNRDEYKAYAIVEPTLIDEMSNRFNYPYLREVLAESFKANEMVAKLDLDKVNIELGYGRLPQDQLDLLMRIASSDKYLIDFSSNRLYRLLYRLLENNIVEGLNTITIEP